MSKKIQIVGLDIPQADWNQTDETQLDYIKNKPDLITYDYFDSDEFSEKVIAALPVAETTEFPIEEVTT